MRLAPGIAALVVMPLLMALGTSATAFTLSLASLAAIIAAVLLSWLRFGRDVLPPGSLPALISYIAGKLPLYGRLVSGDADAHWTRADRGKKHDAAG